MPDKPDTFKNKFLSGQKFEKLAASFYVDNGFDILETNWRSGHKEIDLIVRKDDLIAFVEVKASKTRTYGHPASRVDERKKKNIIDAAQQYLISKEIVETDLRFDVVTFLDGELEFYPDAFGVE